MNGLKVISPSRTYVAICHKTNFVSRQKISRCQVKIFLDDERPTPDGWFAARWPVEVITHLCLGGVTHISLDHDLGDAETAEADGRMERTGYDVLTWLEEQVFHNRNYSVPEITIHSANAAGRDRMMRAIESINRLKESK